MRAFSCHVFLGFAAALALAGCGGGRVALRYVPAGAPAPLTPRTPVFLRVENDWSSLVSRGIYGDKKLQFEGDPVESLQEAFSAELVRLGLPPAQEREPAALLLTVELLEVSCYSRSANTDIAVSLRARTAERFLGQRLLRGTSGPWKRRFASCRKDAPAALAHAMSQLGPILDGEGWLRAAAGSAPVAAAATVFPLSSTSPRPVVLLLPVEDPTGPTPLNVVFEKAYLSGAAEAFDKAAREELRRRGLKSADRLGEADWVIRSVVDAFWGNLGSGRTPGTAQLRLRIQVADRSGAVLWQGSVDGREAAVQWPDAVAGAARAAAGGMGRALEGVNPAPIFGEGEIARGSQAASLAKLLSAASSLSSVHSLSTSIRTMTGGADLLKKAEAGKRAVEAVQSLKSAVEPAGAEKDAQPR